MNSFKNLSLIILAIVLLQGCMMPFGMGAMHGTTGSMSGSMVENTDDFYLQLTAMDKDYSQSLRIIFSELNGNSKYYIKTENIKSGSILTNYDAELNLYRIPSDDSVLDEILKNVVGERIPFTQIEGKQKYLNFSLLEPGQYYIRINIFAIDGEILDSPLSFNYKFDYSRNNDVTTSNYGGVNYWILGAVMVGMMAVFMTVGF